ncbi:MAG: phosphatase PAP2 family protein [Mangrovibacterium sp.]
MFLKSIKHGMLIVALFLASLASTYAQTNEITRSKNNRIKTNDYMFSYKQFIVPASLMLYGTIEATMAPKNRLLNYAIGHEVITHKPEKFQIDDITQYVPSASVYALNLIKIKGKHNFKARTIILSMATLFTAASVNVIKYTARVERPDKSSRNSFPSGHTAVAFMGAEFLWHEYKDVSIWYGIAGYTIATGTGLFRIYNNKHWVGDVAFGAGVGILSTKLAYWLYPTVEKKIFNGDQKKNKRQNIAFFPYYNGKQGGLFLSMQL